MTNAKHINCKGAQYLLQGKGSSRCYHCFAYRSEKMVNGPIQNKPHSTRNQIRWGDGHKKKERLEAYLHWKDRVKLSYEVEEEAALEDGGDAGDGEDGEDDVQVATNEDEAVDALLNLHPCGDHLSVINISP